ncbi:MAG: hypothetical protein K0Q55_1801 [Verrucomicrobia bacterium]|nr:hypothetical protein [Verrucomicrobiota bacterium]
MQQDTLRPTYGIVRPILYVPTAVLLFCGLVLTVKSLLKVPKIGVLLLCSLGVVFITLLSLIVNSWRR